MGSMVGGLLAVLLGVAWIGVVRRWRRAARAEFIRSYRLPVGLYERLCKKRPSLSQKDCELVGHALRQFFLAHLKSGLAFVSMPSQVADELWHEFILYTRPYDAFCRRAFGRFLHHTPAVVLGDSRQSNAGLRRVWWHACREENIHPGNPTRLPLLFALDAKLRIADGFRYAADCKGLRRRSGPGEVETDGAAIVYCGGDFSDASVDGSIAGFGESGSGAGETGHGGEGGHGGDAGADGGSGCGGGGCGGGGGD
jgi:hypothetical protein